MVEIVVVGVSTLGFFPSLLRESRANLAAEDIPVANSSLFKDSPAFFGRDPMNI